MRDCTTPNAGQLSCVGFADCLGLLRLGAVTKEVLCLDCFFEPRMHTDEHGYTGSQSVFMCISVVLGCHASRLTESGATIECRHAYAKVVVVAHFA